MEGNRRFLSSRCQPPVCFATNFGHREIAPASKRQASTRCLWENGGLPSAAAKNPSPQSGNTTGLSSISVTRRPDGQGCRMATAQVQCDPDIGSSPEQIYAKSFFFCWTFGEIEVKNVGRNQRGVIGRTQCLSPRSNEFEPHVPHKEILFFMQIV